MAKIIFACVRNSDYAAVVKSRVESAVHKLVPDNIPDARCKVVDLGDIIYGISTYSARIPETRNAVCLGMVTNPAEKWWKPMSPHPEGSYAIFRADEDHVEALTDIACSRAVWYYKDDFVFVAGTSQRAVISVAGKFEFDRRNIPWMLSSGTQAPSLSWSRNVHFVEPDGAVLLNRKTWEITSRAAKPQYDIADKSDEEHQQQFKELLFDSFRELDVDLSKWILPISGGYDSRGIACFLKETGKDISRLNSVTWGMKASQDMRNSDGYLGGAAARSLGMPHKFWAMDDTKEPADKAFERFIHCSEGRVDHFGGYYDGMAIWKNIFDSGKHGIIRGDETFGGPQSNSLLRSRLLTGCKLCSDFSNLENYEELGLEKQVLPEQLRHIPGVDTPGSYRDRLYQQFRMPYTLSALSDIKYAYTEMLNPFLIRKIVLLSRTLPDHLRNNKVMCTRIIDEISPKIPYATEQATGFNEDILKTGAAVRTFSHEISSDYMKDLFPKEFLNKIIMKLNKPSVPVKSGVVGKLKTMMNRNLPPALRDNLRGKLPKPALDIGMLAFRVYIIGKTYRMFTEDTSRVSEHRKVKI
jgi:hypothetical protein